MAEWEQAHIDDCYAIAETDKAILVRFEDGREEWIPQSQIHEDSEVWRRGHEGTLVIPLWLAEEKELV